MVNSWVKKIIGMPSNLWLRREFKVEYTEIKSIDIELTGRCNLNCKGCNHFSPIAEDGEISIVELQSDLIQLKKVLDKKIKSINLLGGEPLLNEDVVTIMELSRNIFPDTQILILTNGILLKNIDESFWNAAHKNNIKIEITKYPIKFDYDLVKKEGESRGVNVHFFGRSGFVQKTLFTLPIDLDGRQDEEESFRKCYMARSCVTLRKGRLYPCSYAAYMYRFNNYFGRNVPVTDKDSVSIYTSTKEEILHVLGNPIPLCKYCDLNKRTYGNKWEHSSLKEEEWT